MAEIGRVRIRLPANIKRGDIIRVRALVIHPMEIAQRDKQGKIIGRNYHFIHTMKAIFDGNEVMRSELTQGVSQNPNFTFSLKVDRPGKLLVSFFDTLGKEFTGAAEIRFS